MHAIQAMEEKLFMICNNASNQAPAARGRKAGVLLALDLLPLLELCEGIVVHLRSVRESKPTRSNHTKDRITLLDACRA